PGLLQELAGGVVGQHLAAGLAGRAVVDRVAAVLDGADGVTTDRAGLALAVVDGAGALLRRAHVLASALVRERRLALGVDRSREALDLLGGELGRVGERRELRGVADLVGEAAAESRNHLLVPQHAVD